MHHGPDTPHSGVAVRAAGGQVIGDPAVSTTESVPWSGVVATITDSDSDDTINQGQYETITGTVDWGDGSSMPFSVSTAEGGSTSVMGWHTWTETGNYTITITANDGDGGQSVATETASVADGTLTWLSGNNSRTSRPSGATLEAGTASA